MKKINKIIFIETGILIGILILLSSTVFAFAVSSSYWKEYPLEILPGETQEISITLQNMAGAEDITLKGEIAENSQIIAEISDANSIYLVPAGDKTKVNIKITAPENTKLGTYNLITSFSTVTEKEPGKFGFGASIEHTLPVKVIGKESIINSSSSYLIIGIILIAAVILIILVKKRKTE